MPPVPTPYHCSTCSIEQQQKKKKRKKKKHLFFFFFPFLHVILCARSRTSRLLSGSLCPLLELLGVLRARLGVAVRLDSLLAV